MKTRLFLSGLVVGAATALMSTHVISQDAGGDPPMQEMDPAMMQKMMEKGMALATPGEHHEMLEYFVGDWDTQTSIMGSPPAAGTASMRMDLDGRFLHQEFSGNMMGMPMNGVGITGYDNYKKKYVNVWYDSMGTSIRYSEGLLDMTGKVITSYGPMDEWMDDTHDKTVKYVNRIIDENTFVFEVHDLSIVPGETEVVTVTYTRR